MESIGRGAHDLAKGVGEGWTDFQNDATGLLLRGTDAIGLTGGSHDRFDRVRAEVEDPRQAAGYAHPDGWSRTVGNVAGNLVAGAPLAELKPLEALGAAGKFARYGDMALQGAAAGAVTSGGNDIAQNAAIGAALAPALGGAVDLGMAVTPTARAARFATKQAEVNPYAAMDAEIVQDLVRTQSTLKRSPTDPKARAPIDVKAINSVQNGYTVQMKTLIGKLDLPEMEKVRFRAAIEQKHSLPQEDIDALRGTVAGDAVADAIVKTQRLKTLTPEIARDPSLLTRAGNAIGTGLDFVPGVPGIVGRGVRWATKATAGDAEAARVHAAKRLLDTKRGYEKLGEIVGPSGQRESRQALWDAAENALASREAEAASAGERAAAERAARQAESVEAKATRAEARQNAKVYAETAYGTSRPSRREVLRNASTVGKESERSLGKFDERLNAPPAPPKEPTAKDRSLFRKELSSGEIDPRDIQFPQRTISQIANRSKTRSAAISKMERAGAAWEKRLAEPVEAAPDNSNVTLKNNLDDIRPGGGFRGFIYDKTGLLPSQQDVGALTALAQKKISPEQFDAFLKSPDQLMAGNAGNALVDRFAAMADEGRLQRDPKWSPPSQAAPDAPPPTNSAEMVDAQGQPIRSMPAYQAGVQKNISREMPLLQELDAIHAERETRLGSDPEYAKVAGTPADPYVQRILSLRSALAAMKAPNQPK
jgi:hypothetical protein